jgi:hypothetical protein
MKSLSNFFEERDMAFSTINEKGISTAFMTKLPDGSQHAFSLFVLPLEDGFGDSYIRFTIVPFVEQPYDGYSSEMYFSIARYNHDIPQVKFALDEDGDLELFLDLPASQLDDAQFDRVIQILADYASAYFYEIESMISG